MSDVSESRQRSRRLLETLADKRVRHRERHVAYRALFVLAGLAVVLIGIGMVVLPGPAVVVIPLGLSMLAMQFDWAERLLIRVVEQAETAKDRAQEASGGQKLLVLAAGAVALGALAAWAVLGDVPLLPV